MKKMLSLLLLPVLVLTLAACGGSEKKSDGTYTVGICQLAPHDALDAATQGFQDALVAELGEGNVYFDLQNAAGDTNTCATIVNSFVSGGVDLIMANATPALQAAAAATADIPILGTSVTEYGVALSLEGFTGIVGGNISGTSDLAPLTEQAQMIPCRKLAAFFATPMGQRLRTGEMYCGNSSSPFWTTAGNTAKGWRVKRFSFRAWWTVRCWKRTALPWWISSLTV